MSGLFVFVCLCCQTREGDERDSLPSPPPLNKANNNYSSDVCLAKQKPDAYILLKDGQFVIHRILQQHLLLHDLIDLLVNAADSLIDLVEETGGRAGIFDLLQILHVLSQEMNFAGKDLLNQMSLCADIVAHPAQHLLRAGVPIDRGRLILGHLANQTVSPSPQHLQLDAHVRTMRGVRQEAERGSSACHT